MENTDKFIKVLNQGKVHEAEKLLLEVVFNRSGFSQYNDEWIDHRERDLFQAYYKLNDWVSAKKIVNMSIYPIGRLSRIKRLEELSGMKFEDIQ